jgi:Fur family ferric uptake transcriptional regulator
MTIPHETRPLAPASIPAALTTLRARGLRVSAARRLVLEALFAADGPVPAEAIARGLGGRLPGSDLASVYRNLDALEEVGLVRHFHLAGGPGLYVLTGRLGPGYAACERCGAHLALDRGAVARVAAVVREACGYEPRPAHFPIVGRCPDCEVRDAHS